jgi:uncharacterized protein YjeT (DUF2065 family)
VLSIAAHERAASVFLSLDKPSLRGYLWIGRTASRILGALGEAMSFDWRFLITAIGLAFIIEGAPYFLFAERMPSVLKKLSEQPFSSLRILGLFSMCAGLGFIFLGRQL